MTLGEELFERRDLISENQELFFRNSIGAGIFSGFGLGGGIFLVPLFRTLGLNPLQSTATCTFTICLTATMNVTQAIFLGVLTPSDFIFYFIISFTGSFFLSVIISGILRRAHRLSYVELLLFILLLLANVALPFSLWMKWERGGRDWDIILGFGRPC